MISICYETVNTFTNDEIDKYCDGLIDTSQNFDRIPNQSSELFDYTNILIQNFKDYNLVA